MTIAAGAVGHAPTVVIKPIVKAMTVGDLLKALKGVPLNAAVYVQDNLVAEVRYKLLAEVNYISGAVIMVAGE